MQVLLFKKIFTELQYYRKVQLLSYGQLSNFKIKKLPFFNFYFILNAHMKQNINKYDYKDL